MGLGKGNMRGSFSNSWTRRPLPTASVCVFVARFPRKMAWLIFRPASSPTI